MSKFILLTWKIYFILLFYTTYTKCVYFFFPGTPINNYYTILYAFDDHFFLDYFCAVGHVLLNLFQCIPVYMFIRQYKPKHMYFWRITLIFKVVFDITGNSFLLNSYQAFYNDYELVYTLVYFFYSSLLYIPALLIWFIFAFKDEYTYAFSQKKPLKPQSQP